MEMMNVKQLTKKYGSTNVLKGINLTIYQGEVFGFVGHNGAGKSTLIHILTDIVNKSGGSFEILGIPDQHMNQVKKRVGVMPDISNLYENMKGIDFLRYMGELSLANSSKEYYLSLMRDVGLEGAEWKKIKSYSFGMKKKISIAQALLGNPELIILDEPTSGLDPESAIEIRNMITELQKSGKTIFLTSHNLDEIEKICDRVGILSEGVIKKLGTPRELKIAANESKEAIGLIIRTKPVLTADHISQISDDLDINISFLHTKKDYTFLKVTSEDGLPQLSKKIMESGILLYEVKMEEQSLEEVFMNTKEE
ncbi:ABC transporter ATP-binding protein [Gracilibacillus halophilus YIM-C55.5]|uniref:ABC transporter ATP-binding protein n=1 Tax=Gracilibacillus halophilus YIM-C55.5 TaxID=1308866 RepID=N4W5Y0_9BACI|nr:ABC transporter ATP-binding protein [Gracilibacillus halophilus]ENH95598.1 ABC transporter ATP-binding protein [Gracilibacillus halophilus YIM-C55.5]